MRISELSQASGVPVATIKYYLRTGLLHDGRLTSATQAQYDSTHVARLRLVRALISVGDLSIVKTREVVAHLDNPPDGLHDLFGVVQQTLEPAAPTDIDVTPAEALIERMGWQIKRSNPGPIRQLAAALAALQAADFSLDQDALDDYARAMQNIAESEVASVPTDSPEAAVRHVMLGTVLIEPLLLALRRLAQMHASGLRFQT